MSWLLVHDDAAFALMYRRAENLLQGLSRVEQSTAAEAGLGLLPTALTGGDALGALQRAGEALRDALDAFSVPPADPGQSTRPRVFAEGRERMPLRVVWISHAAIETLAAAPRVINLALAPVDRAAVHDPEQRRPPHPASALLVGWASFGRPTGSNLLDGQRVVTQRESVSPILVARCARRHRLARSTLMSGRPRKVIAVLTRSPRIRLSGHGARLRLRQRGHWEQDPLDAVRECCRASMAIDKALGEALHVARARGVSWREVGQALGVAEKADTEQNVVDALAEAKREVWRRFWP